MAIMGITLVVMFLAVAINIKGADLKKSDLEYSIREQNLEQQKEEEEKQTKNRYQALKDQYGRLTERAGDSSGSRKPHRNACELQKITIWSRECRKAWIP